MTAAQPFRAALDKLGSGASDRISALLLGAVPATAPAVAVSIWRSGAPWYEAYAGWVDPETRSAPVGYGTRFDLGALSGAVTATAFLRLAADGKADLMGPVAQTIGEIGASRRPSANGVASRRMNPSTLTFRQLLTRPAGLAPRLSVVRDSGSPPPPPPGAPDPLSLDERWHAALATIGGEGNVARAGDAVDGSDLAFFLLGVAVARHFGQPLSVAVQALVRDRLGLDTLGFWPLERGRPQTSVAPTGVDADWRGRRCWGEPEDRNAAALGGVAGHAGLFASVHDVARFGVAWLRGDPRLRLERLARIAITDQSGTGAGRGLGWDVQPSTWLEPFGVNAYGLASPGTSLVVDPDRDMVVALLTNVTYHGHERQVSGGGERLRGELYRAVTDAFGQGR